jgi:thioredoxin 2
LFQAKPLALGAERFDRHAGSELPLLVDFWAAWCSPCRVMAPVFEQAAQRLEPEFRLAKVDTEAEPSLAGRFGITGIPTLVLMHRGRELARQSGAMPLSGLLDWAKGRVGA